MMKFSNAEHDTIQIDGMPGVNIPNDPRNAHYREIVQQRLDKGETIAAYVPDPAAAESALKAKLATQMMAAIVDDASAGKTLDQIRAEVKAAADSRVDAIEAKA